MEAWGRVREVWKITGAVGILARAHGMEVQVAANFYRIFQPARGQFLKPGHTNPSVAGNHGQIIALSNIVIIVSKFREIQREVHGLS